VTDDVPAFHPSPRRPSRRRSTTRRRSTPRRCPVAASTNRRHHIATDHIRPRASGAVAGLHYLDVTVIDVASHTAYLEPFTGTGFLVLPPGRSAPNSDAELALAELDFGWFLLDDATGQVDTAGRTIDNRIAICLYAVTAGIDDPSQSDIRRALTALRVAARLQPESRQPGPG
jgi:hypothetical protein